MIGLALFVLFAFSFPLFPFPLLFPPFVFFFAFTPFGLFFYFQLLFLQFLFGFHFFVFFFFFAFPFICLVSALSLSFVCFPFTLVIHIKANESLIECRIRFEIFLEFNGTHVIYSVMFGPFHMFLCHE